MPYEGEIHDCDLYVITEGDERPTTCPACGRPIEGGSGVDAREPVFPPGTPEHEAQVKAQTEAAAQA